MLRERENANMDWKYALDNERNIKSSLVQAGQRELAGRRKAEADLAEAQRKLERERENSRGWHARLVIAEQELAMERENGRGQKARLDNYVAFFKKFMERFYPNLQFPSEIPLAQSQTLEAFANPEVQSTPTPSTFHLI